MMTLDEAIDHYHDIAITQSGSLVGRDYESEQLVNWLKELRTLRQNQNKLLLPIRLYLDDERITPEGWVRVFGIEQAKIILQTRRVVELSVDNDLGSQDPKTEGHNLLAWLEMIVHEDPTFPLPHITIHSANAGRVPAMKQVAAKLEIIRQQQTVKKYLQDDTQE